jgi:uncharacterized protein (DUF2164 family)
LKNGTMTENVSGKQPNSRSAVNASASGESGNATQDARIGGTPPCEDSRGRGRSVMAKQRAQSPMRIQLSDDRRASLLRSVKEHFASNFDEPLSDFRAEALLDFFVRELGPPVYNQGVRDASSYIQSKLVDIEGDVYEQERRE